MRRSAVAFALLVLATQVAWAMDTARVVKVVDGDTLDVELAGSVETIRLLGVDTPELHGDRDQVEQFAREAAAFTRKLASGKSVKLERDPRADNRGTYGRLLRYVYLPDGRMLNATIIAEGYGHAMTRYPFSKTDEFRELEREAREAGRGLWGADDEPTASADAAEGYIGRVATICDTVRSARYLSTSRNQPTFLNLGRPYPDQPLTIVIWGADREAFGRPEERYLDRRICVTGKVERFRDKPQIVVSDPSQIVGSGD